MPRQSSGSGEAARGERSVAQLCWWRLSENSSVRRFGVGAVSGSAALAAFGNMQCEDGATAGIGQASAWEVAFAAL